MKEYILDGKEFTNKTISYNYMKKVFKFPSYFSNNLDALWDTLYFGYRDCKIIIQDARFIVQNLDDYGLSILDVFGDLQKVEDYKVSVYW